MSIKWGGPGIRAQKTANEAAAAQKAADEAAAAEKRDYQVFTPEQLAESGIDMNAWFNQYGSTFNPQGDISDLSAYYAGSPVATGYIDAQGKYIATPFAGAYQAGQLRTMQAPQITDLSESAPYQGLSDVLSQMRNYQPMGAEQRAAYGEQMTGMGTGSLASLNQQLEGDISGVQGMSDQEKTLYQRQIQQQIDSTRQENREIMGALSGAGRSIAAYDAMETAASEIADFTIQSQLELINNDWAKKQLEYQAIKDQRDMIVQAGMQGSEQYEQQLNQMWNQTMNGYAQQISTLAQENQQYMEQFSQHAEATYRSMMADIGLSEEAINKSYEEYAKWKLPQTDADWQEALDELLKDLGS